MKRFVSIVCLILSLGAFAQLDSTHRCRIQPLPSVFHTPETSWGVGATLLAFFTPKDTSRRESNAQIFFDVTLRRQASFQSDFNIFTSRNKHYIKGSHDLSRFPELFFGIGNENKLKDRCLIKVGLLDMKLAYYTLLKKNLNIGPLFHHQTVRNLDKRIEQEGITIDEMGYSFTGSGLGVLVDKRNNLLNPSQGYYLESKLSKYFDHTHMTKGFLSHTLDARYYKSFNKLVLNTNLYAVNNSGTVPFRMMPYIGGPRFLRGYYAGRFRDNNLGLFQAEVRRNLFWRFSVAAFSGVAKVYNNVDEIGTNQMHYNYGGGLRFQLHKDSPANIRMDYGRTRDSHGFYIVFGECF